SEIRGDDFILDFTGTVDHYYQAPVMYTGNFEGLAIVGYLMTYYHDWKGPVAYSYTGSEWNSFIKGQSLFSLDWEGNKRSPVLQEIMCRTEDPNLFPVSAIFNPAAYQKQTIAKNLTAPQIHQELVRKAIMHIRSFIIPLLRRE